MDTAMDTAPLAALPTHEEMLARVDAPVPGLRERAEETERIRRLPDTTLKELKEAGIFHLLSPKAVGGLA